MTTPGPTPLVGESNRNPFSGWRRGPGPECGRQAQQSKIAAHRGGIENSIMEFERNVGGSYHFGPNSGGPVTGEWLQPRGGSTEGGQSIDGLNIMEALWTQFGYRFASIAKTCAANPFSLQGEIIKPSSHLMDHYTAWFRVPRECARSSASIPT